MFVPAISGSVALVATVEAASLLFTQGSWAKFGQDPWELYPQNADLL